MLNALRNAAKTWVFKGLFALLVVSFAVWGIGDISFYGAGNRVAQVGEAEVTAEDYFRALQREMQSTGNRIGRPLTMAEAEAMNLPQVLLGRLIRDAALDQEAKDLGLSADDALLREAILESPSFQGLDGTFDQEQYRYVLGQLGFRVDQFEEDMRANIARTMVQAGVAAGAAAPQEAAERLLTQRLEQRKIVHFVLSHEHATDPGVPTDAQLTELYEAEPDAYTAPETRAVTYVAIDADALAAGIEIAEEDLRAAYEEREAQFNTPERRAFDQLVFPNQGEAEAALALIASDSVDFAAIVAERGLDLADVDQGEARRDDLEAPIAAALFAAEPGVTGPVDTPLGPALLNLRQILPPEITTFDDAKESLRIELARAQSYDAAIDLAEQAEEIIAGGAELEDLASELGLALETAPALTRDASDRNGLTADPAFIAEAFDAQVGEDRDLTEGAGEVWFRLRVNTITDAALRPMEEVRDQLLSDWAAARRMEDLTTRAEAAISDLNDGVNLFELAEQYGQEQVDYDPVTRGAVVPGVPPALVETLFAAELGAAGHAPLNGTVVIAQVVDIQTADLTTEDNAAILSAWGAALDQAVGADLYAYYAMALENRDEATINPVVLDQLLNQLRTNTHQ